jgi:hypothetical protein
MIRRRDFITLLGGTAAWPVASRAQQPKRPVIGYLSSVSYEAEVLAGFRQGLADLGFYRRPECNGDLSVCGWTVRAIARPCR